MPPSGFWKLISVRAAYKRYGERGVSPVRSSPIPSWVVPYMVLMPIGIPKGQWLDPGSCAKVDRPLDGSGALRSQSVGTIKRIKTESSANTKIRRHSRLRDAVGCLSGCLNNQILGLAWQPELSV